MSFVHQYNIIGKESPFNKISELETNFHMSLLFMTKNQAVDKLFPPYVSL